MILVLKSSTKYVEGKTNNVKKEYQEEPTLLLICMGEIKQKNKWYFDIGAIKVRVDSKICFPENGLVTFRHASKLLIKVNYKILICLKIGRHQFISNIYYMPNIKNNI